MITRAVVSEAYSRIVGQISAWRENPPVADDGPSLSAEMLQSFGAFVEEFGTPKNVDPDCRESVLAIDAWWAAVVDWAEAVKSGSKNARSDGSDEIWYRWDEIGKALSRKPPVTIEPVATLLRVEPKISHAQICRMYGFVDAFGNLETWKIDDENRDPGVHSTKIKGWLPPETRQRFEEITSRWKKFCDQFSDRRVVETLSSSDDDRVEDYSHSPSESFEALAVLPGMTVIQLSRMFNIPVEEATSRVNELRIKSLVPTPQNVPTESYDAETTAIINSIDRYPELEKCEDRIDAMLSDGVSIGRIVLALKVDFPNINYRMVQKIASGVNGENSEAKDTEAEAAKVGEEKQSTKAERGNGRTRAKRSPDAVSQG